MKMNKYSNKHGVIATYKTKATCLLSTAILLLLIYSCKNPMGTTIVQMNEDYSKPDCTSILPADGDGISRTTHIKIEFTESMDATSLNISGTMTGEMSEGVWSARKEANDTLTLSPENRWTPGSGKNLVIDCKDMDGYDVETIVLTYGVLDGIVYVHSNVDKGNDNNPGTPDLPKLTIQAAVDLAERYYEEADVYVAEGTYLISESIIIQKSISIYGGFSEDNWQIKETNPKWAFHEEESLLFPTELFSVAVSNDENDGLFGTFIITSLDDLTINGFIIKGGTGIYSSAIDIQNASVKIISNKIYGGTGDNSYGLKVINSNSTIENTYIYSGHSEQQSVGILINNSDIVVQNNIIEAGISPVTFGVVIYNLGFGVGYNKIINNDISGGNSDTTSAGIYICDSSNCLISNNIISGGYGECNSHGISIDNSSPLILNNTINGGKPFDNNNMTYAIFSIDMSSPTIENNIIFTEGGTYRCGISQWSIAKPISLKNNDIFDCPTALYSEYDGVSIIPYTSITDIHTEFSTFASGNISLDPIFANKETYNYHLIEFSPIEVRQGGLNLSDQFMADKDENTRTAILTGSPSNTGATGWSIGAFEFD